MKSQEIQINTEYIKLSQFLKFSSIAVSGAESTEIIKEGYVFVNGKVETQRGKKLYPGDTVEIDFDDKIILKVAKNVYKNP